MLHVLALDLKGDPALIETYEAHHRAVWPEVLDHLKHHGIVGMTIYRLGTRLVMLMTTDDGVFDAATLEAAMQSDPTLRSWEDLMWTFQAPTPWTTPQQKWTPMTPIFDFPTGRR